MSILDLAKGLYNLTIFICAMKIERVPGYFGGSLIKKDGVKRIPDVSAKTL